MIDYRHLAGVLDIKRGSITKTPQGYLWILIHTDDLNFLVSIEEVFGGSVFRTRGTWRLSLVGSGAEKLIRKVSPFIILKKKLVMKLLAELDKTHAKEGVYS